MGKKGNGEMKLNRYPKYKPTGIAWLPEVPEGWEVRKVRQLLTMVSRKGFPEKQLLSVTREQGVVVRDVESKEENHNFIPDDLSNYKLVEVGDFVINKMKAWQGSYGVSASEGIVSPAYYTCKLSGVDRRFFSVAIRSKAYVSFFAQLSKGIRVGQWDLSPMALKEIPFLFPPLATQQSIVAFLDEKCGKIDRWVAAKEREVALLKELKQAMIAEAVTRGFDHKVLNFSTGVFWQPLMPEGWCVKKCRHALQKLNRSRPKDAELLVCTNKGTVNKRGDAKIGLVSEDETIYQGVAAGDLLIHGMDTWHGAIAVSELDGMCTPVVHVCDSKENKKFVAFCFQNMARGRLFKLISNGVRQNTSDFRSWEKVAQLPLVLPPRKEQDRIVSYIEARAAKIDAAVAGLEREIAAMKEYKQRLIADVVTGQRKVA